MGQTKKCCFSQKNLIKTPFTLVPVEDPIFIERFLLHLRRTKSRISQKKILCKTFFPVWCPVQTCCLIGPQVCSGCVEQLEPGRQRLVVRSNRPRPSEPINMWSNRRAGGGGTVSPNPGRHLARRRLWLLVSFEM